MKMSKNEFNAYIFLFLGIVGVLTIIFEESENIRAFAAIFCATNLSWIMYVYCWICYHLEELKNGNQKQD
jgi:hypothetical protein